MVIFDDSVRLVEFLGDKEQVKEQLFTALVEWYKKRDSFIGEVIAQDENCQVYANDLLAKIADDLFKFKVTYKDE